jgi:hypothetical protein
MPEFMVLIATFTLIIVLSFLFPFIVACMEKRKIWPYCPQYEFGDFELSTPHKKYISKCGNAALAGNFTYLGKRYDSKGKRYKLLYEIFLSPDQSTVVIIGAGSIVSIPVSSMWFISKDVEGNCFVTLTNQNAVEYDPTGRDRDSLIATESFPKAFRHHTKCINKKMNNTEPFIKNNEIETLRHLKELKLERMTKAGFAKHISQNQDSWKYTLKGAFKLTLCQLTQGVIRFPIGIINALIETDSPHPPAKSKRVMPEKPH